MSAQERSASSLPKGYPKQERVQRKCAEIARAHPSPVYITCDARLHQLSQRKEAALLQIFTNHTLAAHWILRDAAEHKPRETFARFKSGRKTKFYTPGIKKALEERYKTLIRRRYTLNSSVLGGMFEAVAENISGWLQQMAEAQQKGKLQQFNTSGDYTVGYGRYEGKRLGDLGRRTIFGYAFFTPTQSQCEEALLHINALLNKLPEELKLRKQAENYHMKFGSRRGDALGTMRPDTLKRLKFEVERDLSRMDAINALRKAAQTYLRYTPPGFPSVGHDGLTAARYEVLFDEHIKALEEFGALPDPYDPAAIARTLADDEQKLFFDLQRRYWQVVKPPVFFPIRFLRADAAVLHREMGLLYEPHQQRYLLLAHVLHKDSRHKQHLVVSGQPYDVNNPDVVLLSSQKPSSAMLFELDMGAWQRDMLDAARYHSIRWKSEGQTSGSIRSARLHAHYSNQRRTWWFEVQIAVGFKPDSILEPQHVVGVHVNPHDGLYVTILALDGTLRDQFRLDEARIARLLSNPNPDEQASLKPDQRTAEERNHRIADALVAIGKQYQAQLGMENISYRSTVSSQQVKPNEDNSRTLFRMLDYKLPLAHLPAPVDISNIAPRRDCSRCGTRHTEAQTQQQIFTCPTCGHSEPQYANTAREVARRILWRMASRKPPKKYAPPSQQTA